MMRLSWLISMGISLFGVLLIEHFFTMQLGDNGAADGNLGALGLALVAPFILLSLVITFRYFTTLSRNSVDLLMRSIYIGFGIVFFIAIIYFAIDYKNEVFAELGGTTKDPNSIIYGFPWLNEYTNRVYINFYTFAATHSFIAIIGAVTGMFTNKQSDSSELEQKR